MAALVVEVDVGDDRDLGRLHDLRQRRGRFLVRAGDADDVAAGRLEPAICSMVAAASAVSVLVMVWTVIARRRPPGQSPPGSAGTCGG
jgi:hypothetical protein